MALEYDEPVQSLKPRTTDSQAMKVETIGGTQLYCHLLSPPGPPKPLKLFLLPRFSRSSTFSMRMKAFAVLLLVLLPLCDSVDVQCSTNARSFKDARTEVRCPAGCDTQSNAVWGTNIYTDDSSICRAAIHDGKLSSSGGSITVEKRPGQSSYQGSNRNGVTTNSYGSWTGSFVLSPTTPGFIETIQCASRANGFKEDNVTVQCPAGCAAQGYSLWGTTIYTEDSSVCAAAIHAGVISNSGGVMTVEKLAGQSSYQGSTQNGITSVSYGSYRSSFTFHGLVPSTTQMIQCASRANGFKENNVTVQCPAGCTTSYSLWGTTIYTEDSSVCAAAIHAGVISNSGGVVTVEKRAGQSSYQGSTQNGITSVSYGSYPRSFTFHGLVPSTTQMIQCASRANGFKEDNVRVQCPAGCAAQVYSLWGTNIYTEDSSVCAAAVHAGVMSNSEGGVVTVEKRAGQSSYQGSTQNGITSVSYGSYPRSFTFHGLVPNTTQMIQCTSRANGFKEDNVTVQCPAGCATSYSLWGTTVYTEDSSVCAAAIHAGVISNLGGVATVEKRAGQSSYQGSTQNGITSVSYGSYPRSFTFHGLVPTTTPLILCSDKATSLTTEIVEVMCPEDCDAQSYSVWGTSIYTDDSSICRAAIHDGKLSSSGGTVTVEKKPGQSSYQGSNKNGVTTNSYGAWSGSFVLTQTDLGFLG